MTRAAWEMASQIEEAAMTALSTFNVDTTFPPSLVGQPLMAMFVTMAFWASTLLCLQWIYAIIDDWKQYPMGRRHPLTGTRIVKLLILLVILFRTFPRLMMLMLWDEMSPDWREIVARVSWLILIPTSAVFAFAWFVDRVNRTHETFLLRRLPVAEVEITTRGEKSRAALILLLVFVVSFATTYIRPDPRDAATVSISQH